jgi:hypothetical protein
VWVVRDPPSDRARDHHVTWVAVAVALAAADLAWQADAVWAPAGVSALGPGPLRAIAGPVSASTVAGVCAWASALFAVLAAWRTTARGPWLLAASLTWGCAAGALDGRLASSVDVAVFGLGVSAAATTGWRPGRIVAAGEGWPWFALRVPWIVLVHAATLRMLGDDGSTALARSIDLGDTGAWLRANGPLCAAAWIPWPWLPRVGRVGLALLGVAATLAVSATAYTGVAPLLAIAVAFAAFDDDLVASREPRAQWTAPAVVSAPLRSFVQRTLLLGGLAWAASPAAVPPALLRAWGIPPVLPPTQGDGPLTLTADGEVVAWRALGSTDGPWMLPTTYPRIDAALGEDPACADVGDLAARVVTQLSTGSAPVAATVGDLRFAAPTPMRIAVRTAKGTTCASHEGVR